MIFPKFNRIYASILLVQLTTWLLGTSLSWTSPMLPKLSSNTTSPVHRAITLQEASWISSLLTIGALIGPFLSGYAAKGIGKKWTLLVLGVPFIIAFNMMAFAETVQLFYFARFINGLAVGGTGNIATNYAIELSNKNNRGLIGAITGVVTSIGMLFSYVLGPYLDVISFNLVVVAVTVTFMVTFLLVGTECPVYYLCRGDEEKAREVIEMKQGSCEKADIDREIHQIKSDLSQEQTGDVLQLFKTANLRKLFFIAVSLFVIQELCGGIFIQYYNQPIFELTGASLSAEHCAIIVGIVNFISSLIPPFIFDRYGRKKILVASCLGMFITHIPMASYIYISDQNIDTSSFSFVPIITMALNILAYNIGAGPLPWLILAELFPQRVKISATSLVVSFNWILSFFMTYSFGIFMHSLGLAFSFLLFGGLCLIFAIYSLLVIPETKGKTLEELHIDLTNN